MDALYPVFDSNVNRFYTIYRKEFRSVKTEQLRSVKTEQDRISSLPDSVICHVLSRLPTKDAVRTSILSRDWVYKWTSIYYIDIHYHPRFDKFASFSSFMDWVLDYTLNSELVRSFRLSTSDRIPGFDQFKGWISTALTSNVEYLEISARLCPSMDLPQCFPSCSTLTGLNLLLSCTLKIDTDICFPNLKSLYLGGGRVEIVNDQQSPNRGQMLMTFPVLEDLELRNCEWVNAKSVEIRAPELIKFKATYLTFEKHSYSVNIIGPKLAKFELPCSLPDNFIFNAPEVSYAALEYNHSGKDFSLQAHTILMWFAHLQHLELSADALKELVPWREDFSLHSLCELKSLKLSPLRSNKELSVLLKPQVLPSLESLDLNLWWFTEYKHEKQQLIYSPCIAPQLREVKFSGFQGSESEFNLVKFFLQNGQGLKSVSIILSSGKPRLTESGITRYLSKILPKSSTCLLLVHKA